MHRKNLLNLLDNYKSKYTDETDVVDRFIYFVRSNKGCFERSLEVGHVTGSAWIISQDGSQTLLTHHRKLDKWLQLGGHADGQNQILNVAQREAFEESGLSDLQPVSESIFDIDIHLIPERKNEPAHHHYDVRFALQATHTEKFIVSDESHSLAWVPIHNLESKTNEESVLRMGRKWL